MKSTNLINLFCAGLLLFFSSALFAQTLPSPIHEEECGFDQLIKAQIAADPNFERALGEYNKAMSEFTRSDDVSRSLSAADIIRIPVVVHIIHSPGEMPGQGQNLSDARVQAQMDVMNEDFSATNPNWGDTPARWVDSVGNPQIQFCLASIDPLGNPTSGIVRHDNYTVIELPVAQASSRTNLERDIKPNINWNPNLYYNIYVCPIPNTTASGGRTGYAYLPFNGTIGNGSTDGTVVDYRWFGGPGFGQSGSRTMTHESGHYLGLYHPFNDESCAADDFIQDTPNIDSPSSGFGCTGGFGTGPMSCGNEAMYINYMDYSRSSCKTSFTNDQITMMRGVLEGTFPLTWGSRASLANNALAVCTFNTNDASVAEVLNPSGFICDTAMLTPEVKITNFGIDPLTTVTINYQVNNDPVVSFVWIDNLQSGASSVVALPSFSPPSGAFNFKAYTTLPNGLADENINNDTLTIQSFRVVKFDIPLAEDFEDVNFNPTVNNIFNFNPDQDTFQWKRAPNVSAYGNGNGCAVFDNYYSIGSQGPGGKVDGMITQFYDFSSVTDAQLKFDLAYTYYSFNGNEDFDSLLVVASIDCGANYNIELFKDGYQGLATAPPTGAPFTPTANQWETKTLDLTQFYGEDNLSIAFINASGFGNFMYLDNINLSAACSITTTETQLNVNCFGECTGMATVTPDGGPAGYDFLWDTNASSQTTQTAIGLCAGTYDVTVSTGASCTKVLQFTITEFPELTLGVSGTNLTGVATNDGTATATPSGGDDSCYDYLWSNSGVTSTISNLPPDTYMVTVTDCSGCSIVETVVVEAFDCSGFSYTSQGSSVLCNGDETGDVSLSPTGGSTPYVYTWEETGLNGANPSGLGAGTYLFTITDNDGCTLTGSETVDEPPVLGANTDSTPISSIGATDGTASAMGTGGTPPYIYVWGIHGIGSPITGLGAGTYPVTVSDSRSCIFITEVTVEGFDCSNLVLDEMTSTPVSCEGDANGTATITMSSGATPFAYKWNAAASGQINATAVGLAAGIYRVTVTDNDGCTLSSSVEVTSPDLLSFTFENISNVICEGESNGEFMVEVSGGTPGYDFSWGDISGNTPTRTGLSAGIYCLTLTDVNGCSDEDCFTITEPDAISITFSGNMELDCFGDLSEQIDFAVSGGNPGTGYLYEWSPPQSPVGSFLDDLPAGLYVVTVTDGMGCTGTNEFEINQPTELTVNLSSTPETSAGANDGTASAMAMGGTIGYSFAWTPTNSGPNLSSLAPGVYEVTVTDAKGCTAVESIVVGAGNVDCSMFDASISMLPTLCFDGTDGSATAAGSGGTTPYTYVWSNSDTGPSTSSGLPAGLVMVTITDANNCIVIKEIEITQPPELGATFSVMNESSPGAMDGSVTATGFGGTPGYTYEWNPGAIAGATLAGVTGGTYFVIVTDDNGCTWTMPVVIETETVDCSSFSALISTTDISCFGFNDGTATAIVNNGTMPYSYVWSNADTGPFTDNLPPGLVLVTVTDANNCTFIAENFINEPAELNISLDITPATSSTGGIILVDVTGGTPGYNYNWSDLVGSNNIEDRFDLAPGLYNLTVTDSNGCTKVENDIPILDNVDCSNFSLTVIPEFDNLCFGDTDGIAFATATGGTEPYEYIWSNSDTGPLADNLPGGIVTVTVTDANDCVLTGEVTIFEPNELQISQTITPESGPAANDGIILINVTGGTMPYNYDWTDIPGTNDVEDRFGVTGGSYEVLVTDANGCSLVEQVVVTTGTVDCSSFMVSLNQTDITCFGFEDGTATANPVGGTMPYSYTWSTADTTQMISNLPPGFVSVTVTDNGGCTFEGEVIIQQPDLLQVSTAVTNESSVGANDGSITANPIGGTMPYTYIWDPTNVGQTIAGLAPGIYALTVTDANGCTVETTAEVLTGQVDCSSLNSFVSTLSVTCGGGADGIAAIVVTGGTTPYNISWENGQTGTTAIGLPAGPIGVTITDANNCMIENEGVVTEPDPVTVTISHTDETTDGLNDGTATAMGAGGTGPYTYDWGFSLDAMVTGLSPAVYVVIVTDSEGCSTTGTVEIMQGQTGCTLTGSIEGVSVSCNGTEDGMATATPFNGTAPFTYVWSNGDTGDMASNLPPGPVFVTITAADNCTFIAEGFIEEPDVLTAQATGVDESILGASDGSASAAGSGGTAPYTYDWGAAGTGQTIDNLMPGLYIVLVTDSRGCTAEAEVFIEAGPPDCTITLSFESTPTTCFGTSDGTAQVFIDGGTAPYGYQWSGNPSVTSEIIGSAGSYEVTITDANGCEVDGMVVIEEPAEIILSVVGFDGECGGSATAVANVTGGSSPYTYLWSTGATEKIIGNLLPGTYLVTVTDANGCTNSGQTSVVVSNNGVKANVDKIDVGCFGGSDGAIDLTITQGTAPFDIVWSNNATSEDISGLPAGDYNLQITDAEGCVMVRTVEISSPSEVKVAVSTSTANPADQDGTAIALASGGVPPYSYEWSTGNTGPVLNDLSAGAYLVTVTDANGCSTIGEFDIFTTGIEGIVSLQSWEVNPNPSSGLFYLQASFTESVECEVVVFNLLGQEIFHSKERGNSLNLPIDLSGMAAGTYYLRLKTELGQLVRPMVLVK